MTRQSTFLHLWKARLQINVNGKSDNRPGDRRKEQLLNEPKMKGATVDLLTSESGPLRDIGRIYGGYLSKHLYKMGTN
jgi:hypothetical protein